jgi:hypothetical protein
MIPKEGLAKEAAHLVEVRNSTMETSRKKAMVSKIRTRTIPIVVKTEV